MNDKSLRLKTIGKGICLLLGGFLLLTPIYGDVIYRQTFGVHLTSNRSLAHVMWTGHSGEEGTPVSGVSVKFLSYLEGYPGDGANVNTRRAQSESLEKGYVAKLGQGRGLVWTDEFTLERGAYTALGFRFHSRNDAAADQYRIAVRIGNQWFVSEQTFADDPAPGGQAMQYARRHDFRFQPEAGLWRRLDFVPGKILSVAEQALQQALPAGDITAFGLFMDQRIGSAMRFDTFEIHGVSTSGRP